MDNNGQYQQGYQGYNQEQQMYAGNMQYQQPMQYEQINRYQYQQNVDPNMQYQQNINQMGYDVNQVYNQTMNYTQDNYEAIVTGISFKRRILNFSAITGIIAATLILIGMLIPAMDFSTFHENIDIQYNIIKICENVRMISSVWTALPWGIVIGIVGLYILSFLRIPQFKLIPCMIILAMFIIMLVDMKNVIVWADEFLNGPLVQELVDYEFVINKDEIIKSFQPGIYLMIAGTVLGIISCFSKPIEEK